MSQGNRVGKNSPDHRPVPARVLQGVAFALAIVGALPMLLLPVYTSETSSGGSGSPNGPVVTEQPTSLAVNGPAIFVPLLIPVLLTGLPLPVRPTERPPTAFLP